MWETFLGLFYIFLSVSTYIKNIFQIVCRRELKERTFDANTFDAPPISSQVNAIHVHSSRKKDKRYNDKAANILRCKRIYKQSYCNLSTDA